MSSARRTYDTDSIVLRRIFAYDISNNTTFSTGYVLTSLGGGPASFVSPFVSLSTIGYLDLPANVSTIAGELLCTVQTFAPTLPSTPQIFLPSTVTGLGTSGYISTSQLVSTVAGLSNSGYIIEPDLTSTTIGLGTLGYVSTATLDATLISTVQGIGNTGFISTSGLLSTVEGLGSAGYVSSSWLNSTVAGLGETYLSSGIFTNPIYSSIIGLGTLGYVSSTQLFSTVEGLGSANYISSASLLSSIEGLGTLGYVSTLYPIYRSSYSNLGTYNPPNWSNTSYLYLNFAGGPNPITTINVDLGPALLSNINPGVSKLDIQFKENMQFGFYNTTSGNFYISTNLKTNGVFLLGETLQYYILNSNVINVPYITQESFRFIITDSNILNTIKSSGQPIVMEHQFDPVPSTTQFFASPSLKDCVYVVLDNTPK